MERSKRKKESEGTYDNILKVSGSCEDDIGDNYLIIEDEYIAIENVSEAAVVDDTYNNHRRLQNCVLDESTLLDYSDGYISNEQRSENNLERIQTESTTSLQNANLPEEELPRSYSARLENGGSICEEDGYIWPTILPTSQLYNELREPPRDSFDYLPQEPSTSQPLLVENDLSVSEESESRNKTFEGRRITDPLNFYEELRLMYIDHGFREQCSFHDIYYEKCRDEGLCSKLKFVCNHCDYFKWDNLIDKNGPLMPLHNGAVSGTITAGTGYSELKQEFASMGLKCMSNVTYRDHRQKLVASFEKTAEESMNEAAEMERELAIAEGDVIDEIPFITVQVDGSWLKRSYRSGKCDSLSGCAAIIGCRTKKVLYVGVRNKQCHVCDLAAKKGCPPKKHDCYKNWGREQSSSSMEKDMDKSTRIFGKRRKT